MMMPLLLQHRREGSRPQQRHREVTTIMVSSTWGFRMFPDLQTMCRLAVFSRFVTGCDDHVQYHDPDFRYSFPYDSAGNLYAPGRPRPAGYSRAEGYIWAVLSARDNFRVPIDRVVTCVPDAEDASRFWPVPTVEQVHWYLRGWSQHYVIDGQRRQAY